MHLDDRDDVDYPPGSSILELDGKFRDFGRVYAEYGTFEEALAADARRAGLRRIGDFFYNAFDAGGADTR